MITDEPWVRKSDRDEQDKARLSDPMNDITQLSTLYSNAIARAEKAEEALRNGVKVKPLEWCPFRAETDFGYYFIDDQTDRSAAELAGRDPFLLTGSRLNLSRHKSLKAAKAAAQADYDFRILSALVLPPPPVRETP